MRHVYLTWQHNPSKTITVNVHGLKTPADLFIHYDTRPCLALGGPYAYKCAASGRLLSFLPGERRLYQIELTDLDPGQTYYFAIGDDYLHFYSREFQFKTIPDDGSPLLFVEGGDWENTAEAAALAKQAASLSPLAALLGGDYPSQVFSAKDYRKWDAWLDVYQETMVTPEGNLIPMVMAIGNHEVVGGFGKQKEHAPFFFHYFKQGETGESYFSLPFGKHMHLFVLDSGHTTSQSGKQKEWLTGELQKHQHIPIKMAIYHVPLFPSIHFSEKDLAYRSFYGLVKCLKGKIIADKLFSKESLEGRRHWLPLFDQYALSVAFEHHDQTLKRTKQLRNGREDSQGTLFLGDGGWGSVIQYHPIQGYFHRIFAYLQGKEHFFWLVEARSDSIHYQAMDASGKVLDHYLQPISQN